MRLRQTLIALLSLCGLVACGSAANVSHSSDTPLNYAPAPAALLPVRLPPGTRIVLPATTGKIAGAIAEVAMIYPASFETADRAIFCHAEFEQAFYEREFKKDETVELVAARSEPTTKWFNSPETQLALAVKAIQSDFVFNQISCSVFVKAQHHDHHYYYDSVELPTMEELACLFDIKIPLPAGRSNPALTCSLNH